jgi:hypothetical protein
MLSSVLKMLSPREVNWAMLNGCFGSMQSDWESTAGFSGSGVCPLGAFKKSVTYFYLMSGAKINSTPFIATKTHKTHVQFRVHLTPNTLRKTTQPKG